MLDNWGIFYLLGYKCVFQYGLFLFFQNGCCLSFFFWFPSKNVFWDSQSTLSWYQPLCVCSIHRETIPRWQTNILRTSSESKSDLLDWKSFDKGAKVEYFSCYLFFLFKKINTCKNINYSQLTGKLYWISHF